MGFPSISDDGCNIASLKCHKSPAPKPWGARGRETSRVRGWRRMKFQTSNITTIDQKRHTDILDEMKELPKPRKIIYNVQTSASESCRCSQAQQEEGPF